MHNSNNHKKPLLDRIPAFSIVLVFVILIIIGAANIPLLNIQYTPTEKKKSLDISFSWTGASARVIENEVTSKLEGAIASVRDIQDITSITRKDRGTITIELKPKADMDMIRFEIATLIRQIYSKLPEGVSFPTFSASSSGEGIQQVMTYTINANLPTKQIEQYTQNNIVNELSLLPGVSSVNLSGATPFYVEILFNPDLLRSYGLTIRDISSAISVSTKEDAVGFINTGTTTNDELAVILKGDGQKGEFENIPLKNVDGRIIFLRDVAEVSYKEKLPTYYFRINGLNTINVTIYPEKYVNTLNLCDDIKTKMAELELQFPEDFSATVSYDSSIDIKKELNKIIKRTIFSVLILLAFVLIVSRSLRYLFIITITLIANIFIAFIFYNLLDLEIHLYSLAGITVSLGLIIDTSIIMISHYTYYRNRKAFIAILAALLTSIGSLLVVFFLPEEQKVNLIDFSAVIIINLAISMLIALIFVPAFITKLPIYSADMVTSVKVRRRVVKISSRYKKFINWGVAHKWIFVVILILGFGLPIHMLPEKIEVKKDQESNFWIESYNKTIGSDLYQKKMKKPLEIAFGGTLRIFSKNLTTFSFYRTPSRPNLNISASMPEGCTVQQLNDILKVMENYLSQFDIIERFTTSIYSYSNGRITVTFKKDVENSALPLMLKSEIIAKAIDYGGANWSVSGIDDQYFNNSVYSGYKSHRIVVSGYNYDQLYSYCEELSSLLNENRRVQEPGIYGQVGWNMGLSRNEFFIDYNRENLAVYGISTVEAYSSLYNQLYSSTVNRFFDGETMTDVVLKSSNVEKFDVWHLSNEYTEMGDQSVRFSDVGSIEKRQTGNDIYKKNQQYQLTVAFDYVGSQESARRLIKKSVDTMNDEVLPIGFKAEDYNYRWYSGQAKQYWLLFLVIAIIYFICAILFESLIKPFAIILLIPVSFIGLFLIFYITGYTFDQGGFASLIMLAGLTVNSGIYIVNEYNLLPDRKGRYVKAYNHKIIPIMLTILSTVLGLIPFLFDGPKEVFWFAFALGNIGGLLFSIVALLIYLPIFIVSKKNLK